MNKLLATVALATILAGCSNTTSHYLNVATGVDSNGNVIIERVAIPNKREFVTTSNESLSDGPCLNRSCAN